MQYRRLQPSDLPQLLALQHQNLFSNLTAVEREHGYLLRAFTGDEFLTMDRDVYVMVAVENEQLLGYLCANLLIPDSPFPFAVTMYQHCQNTLCHGKNLTDYRAVLSSPACVVRDRRGGIIFYQLCNAMLKVLDADNQLAITLVSVDNQTSLSACEAIGFQKVNQFLVSNDLFWLMVCELDLKNKRSVELVRVM